MNPYAYVEPELKVINELTNYTERVDAFGALKLKIKNQMKNSIEEKYLGLLAAFEVLSFERGRSDLKKRQPGNEEED